MNGNIGQARAGRTSALCLCEQRDDDDDATKSCISVTRVSPRFGCDLIKDATILLT